MNISTAPPRSSPGVWLRALRSRQWVKNVLIFLPLVFAHQWENPALATRALLAFAIFCAGASGIYLVNDLMDEAADREHPVKRLRPLAAGLVTRGQCWVASVVLLVCGAAAAWGLSRDFLFAYLIYVITACAYSMWLKRVMLLDAIMLAGFYTLRLFAGAVATDVVLSNWLLLFSLFFFLGLAFQKRFAELRSWGAGDEEPLRRRGYVRADLDQLRSLGTGSSYLAVLILALYLKDPYVAGHYQQPAMLWWILPCLLYWLSRIWLLAGRGEVSEDAIAFAVKDRVSYIVAALVAIIAILAKPV